MRSSSFEPFKKKFAKQITNMVSCEKGIWKAIKASEILWKSIHRDLAELETEPS